MVKVAVPVEVGVPETVAADMPEALLVLEKLKPLFGRPVDCQEFA
jgi:hypothetical protein